MMRKLLALFPVLITASGLLAQGPNVQLLHGLNERGVFGYTTNLLRYDSGLEFNSLFDPILPDGEPYGTQVSSLLYNYGGYVNSSTILIGHSNGGIVARMASRQGALAGVATIASPNGGAPLVNNDTALANFASEVVFDFLRTISDFMAGDEYWIYDNALYWAYTWVWDHFNITGSLLHQFAPATGDLFNEMSVGSPFQFDTLNHQDSLTLEGVNIGNRVAIIDVAEDFYVGGPFRMEGLATGHYIHDLTWGGGLAALLGEEMILDSYPCCTAQQYNEANDLDVLSTILWGYEDVWCAGTNQVFWAGPPYMFCYDNDVTLSDKRQSWAGVDTIQWFGPTHAEEPYYDPGLYDQLLRIRFHVPTGP